MTALHFGIQRASQSSVTATWASSRDVMHTGSSALFGLFPDAWEDQLKITAGNDVPMATNVLIPLLLYADTQHVSH